MHWISKKALTEPIFNCNQGREISDIWHPCSWLQRLQLQCFVSRHQKFVSMLQLKWANLREVERGPARLISPRRIPTLRSTSTDISYESPIHLDCVLFRVPFKWILSIANWSAGENVDGYDDGNQVKQWWPHVVALLPFNPNQSANFKPNLYHLANGWAKCFVSNFMRCCSTYSKFIWMAKTWGEKKKDFGQWFLQNVYIFPI